MKFDSNGKKRINKKIEIDFDKMAIHILTLEKVSRQNGYKIKKVILETNLKDEIFRSEYGEELKNSNIYFVRALPKMIDELHDDHYHIDFVKL
jgi:penicillin-insensitive murein endopeptidase